MKQKIMDGLQKFSKGMFIPVLILPIAGILIAIGNVLTNAKLLELLPFLDNPVTTGFGKILSGSLVAILVNLGLIFCVGLAVGLADKKKSEAGFTALLAFLVFINAMNKFMDISGILVASDALRGSGQTMILGVQVLDMGVFLGIILGIVTAKLHNKYAETEFNNAFQIYGGSRYVFIVLIPVTIILAVVLTYIWPFIQTGISNLGGFMQDSGNFGIFLYGALERLLIPTGLHHLVYTPFLYSAVGGTAEIGGQLLEGSRNIYYAEITDTAVKVLSPSVVWDARGISKMFGLIGACLAMYHTAKPENRTKVKAILIPAAFTAFIAGVTEPIEFSFMFVAPLLFVLHAGLTGLGMVAFNVFGSRAIGPNGFIDFLLFNLPLGIEKTRWPIYIAIGVVQFFIYYFVFKFVIKKFNFKTLGREVEGQNMKLYSKKEYKDKVAGNGAIAATKEAVDMGAIIVKALGGAANITKVDNCYTRLRVVLKDTNLVNEDVLKNETAANAVVIKGENVQVVYGLKVNGVRRAVDQTLGNTSDGE